MKLSDVNALSATEFVTAFGDIAEHSPWVAQGALKSPHRPVGTFSHLQGQTGEGGRRSDEGSFATREDLIHRFIGAVLSAPEAQQLSLLRAHPDLATRAKLTTDSTREQQGAGLDTLSASEFESFTQLNNAYKAKNDFPFIFAVKGATKFQILKGFETRIANDSSEEFQTALEQVCRIIRFRIEDRVQE